MTIYELCKCLISDQLHEVGAEAIYRYMKSD